MPATLVPKLFTTLRGYTREQFMADVTAGIIVGIIALPLAIAFAIASGVAPERGLYTAIIAGFIISALGGSRVQIGGPTGAFVVIVYGIVQQYGIDGLTIATIMAGVILIGFGVARLGGALKFIPHPVIIGFTSGIAVIIFSSQVSDLLGMRLSNVPAAFVARWEVYGAHLADTSMAAAAVAAGAIVIMLLWPRVGRRIPGPFVALIVTTVVAVVFRLPVETIGTRFGGVHAGLPMPALPHVTLGLLATLVPAAFTIALLAAVESLLSAVVADGMIGGRHRSNMELIAQGVANIVAPLFGGMPATGAIARTATNVRNGGRTPVAGMMHAVTLLLITLFFGHWAAFIPLATLAAILVVVAYHMSEWRTFVGDLRGPASDVLVMVATFVLTVLVNLTVAIEVGMVLAAFLFMKRMAEVTNVTAITREYADPDTAAPDDAGSLDRTRLPAGVVVYEINGPFFFGAATAFRNAVGQVAGRPRVLIIRMRHVPAMDATGLHALKDLVRRSRREGTRVILTEVHAQPMMALARSLMMAEIGEENLAGSVDVALRLAAESPVVA
ncbi:MAG TPA: sulfate permease [Gemmatimonadales bacterium]|jgi:SulP family sulfate permease|nr:sulfate permease [Gemmatimonadales bacterium]